MRALAAMIFVFLFAVQGFGAGEKIAIAWPNLGVHFAILGETSRGAHDEGIAIYPEQGVSGAYVIHGKLWLMPSGGYTARKINPDATITEDIAPVFPYRVVGIGKSILILDQLGWIVRIPVDIGPGMNLSIEAIGSEALLVHVQNVVKGTEEPFIYKGHILYKFNGENAALDKVSKAEFLNERFLTPLLNASVYTLSTDTEEVERFQLEHVLQPDLQKHLALNFKLLAGTDLLQIANAAALRAKESAAKVEPALAPEDGVHSGIQRLRESKAAKNDLLTKLKAKVFGQDFALERIVERISDWKKSGAERPLVLMAVGTSGGGKTYAAEVLSQVLGGGTFTINGSEFRAHAGSLDYQKLFGSKGGQGQVGALVKFAGENPKGGTLIINEIEKMNPDILIMLMEFLDRGEIATGAGEVISMKNLVVIGTSNRGALRMYPPSAKNLSQAELDRVTRSFTQDELMTNFQSRDGLDDKTQFSPEILRRFTEFIPFAPTTSDAAIMIARSTVAEVNGRYHSEYTVTVDFNDDVVKDIALTAWGMSSDARTIGRSVRALMSSLLDESVDGLDLKGGEKIKVEVGTDRLGHKIYIASANGKKIEMAAVRNPLQNPIFDKEFRERLRNMKSLMSEIVTGQADVIADIAEGVFSHFARGKNTRPFSTYLLGVSGNGKTELGRALAKVVHNDEKRAVVIPMGNITNESDFDKIFGSSAQFQGGDIERLFEKALRENPNGAVIILDEISNMGGGDLARKTGMFMKLYDILEEGRYVSPIDGRVYDLTKYQFVLTGNDGEGLFFGIKSDDLLMSTWESNKKPETVREMLRAAGIPNAFINRVNVVALTKPLLWNEVLFVTSKLFAREVKAFKSEYLGVEIEPGPDFRAQLSKTFFTADQGGRSVRKILEDKLGALFLNALIEAGADPERLEGYKVVIDLSDNAPSKAFVRNPEPRKVEFSAKVYKKGKLVHTEVLDLTRISPEAILPVKAEARSTAIHEAGHAIANLESVTGEALAFITIRSGTMKKSTGEILHFAGYARYDKLPGAANTMDREMIVAKIASLFAGRKAQELAGLPLDSGAGNDLEKVGKFATMALTKWALDRDFVGVSVDNDGNPRLSGKKAELFEQRREALIHEGEKLAEELLLKNWRFVSAVTAELMLKSEIKRDRFIALKKRFAGATARFGDDGRPKPMPSSGSAAVRCEVLFTGR